MQYIQGLKTFIGILIAAVPTVAQLAGYEVAPTFSEDATSLLQEFITLCGLTLAFYGRMAAKTPGLLAKKPE